jgi:hypothetical protein
VRLRRARAATAAAAGHANSDEMDSLVAHWAFAGAGGPWPSPRAGHVAAAFDKRGTFGTELVVIHGGVSPTKEALGDLHVLAAESGDWLALPPARVGPAARAFHAAATVGSALYVFGEPLWWRSQIEFLLDMM